jgi:hypothetical protein
MLNLSDEARGRLCGLVRGPGYPDLVELIEALSKGAELELMNLSRMNGATNDQILSGHDQARAFRLCGQSIVDELTRQVAKFIEDRNQPALTDEQILGLDERTNEEVLGMLVPGPEGS